ncbi:MAG TPA: DMT family transporter [Pirellulaceae bacterium]|nr:DMT family transporter [Pirellulaceae bacterium]
MLLATEGTASLLLAGPSLWMPLTAAMLFALGGLLLKRSAQWRVGVWRTTFVANMLAAIVFMPLLLLGGQIPSWLDLWQPLIVALLYILGQTTTLLALTRGDVSIATPVLGLKILGVAVFATLLIGRPLPMVIWIAAGLATAGVMLLNANRGKTHHHVAFSIGAALAGAATFALFDVCVQIWAPAWGVGRFLPIVFSMSAVLSLGLLPLLEGKLSALPRAAWPWLAGGAGLIAVQALLIVCTVAIWQQATAANVAYSTRGLWSVLFVWLLGERLGVHDQSLRGWVFWTRLAGASLLLISVLLLVL